MLTKLLASRFAGPIISAVGILLMLGVIVQSYRYGQAYTLAESRAQTIAAKDREIAGLTGLIGERDALIAKQNEGIEALKKQREEDREAYLRQYAAADERAKSNDARAKQLVAMQASSADELTQCREARALLLQELVK